MIVLHVTYKVEPGKKEDFYKAVCDAGIPQASREERGNIKYDYYVPAGINDEVFLVEIWQDEDSIKAHNKSEHFKKLQAIKANYVKDVTIDKY